MGGMLLHQTRWPVKKLTVASCTSGYSRLEALCVSEYAQNRHVNFIEGGGMGMDPVFTAKTELFDPKLSKYPEMWYDMRKINQTVDPHGTPYGFQHFGSDVMGDRHGAGFPVFLAAHLPAGRMEKVSCMACA